ncbi:plastocyanin/azurin family copper-binding protein [Euzebya rosea]|uniref:plastocyanin/azurin family copper-binding protein n=1 Tax=Euzebya rosea TaxID=2052804 RepID=UPI000D3E67F5|nr:plastocyanin/azurin family copper-binding protein [Euzebya rosea]
MNQTTRRRVFVPLVMPLTLLGAVLLFSGSLSRVLLAVETEVSVLVAVLAAGYVMATAFVVERNPDISSRALGVGMVLGIAGIVGAGIVAGSVGIRDVHHEEHAEEGGEVAEEGAVAIPEGALVWGADNGLAYTSAPSEGTAGENIIAIDNAGSLEHNVVFEGLNNDQPVVASAGGADVAPFGLDAGTYTYYCSIPGHRAAGMEGEITLS